MSFPDLGTRLRKTKKRLEHDLRTGQREGASRVAQVVVPLIRGTIDLSRAQKYPPRQLRKLKERLAQKGYAGRTNRRWVRLNSFKCLPWETFAGSAGQRR
jgi:hypothetical protein